MLRTLLAFLLLFPWPALCGQSAPGETAREKPLVVVLATGGTIAGRGGDATVTVGYKAAVVGVEALVETVPELRKLARIRAEQVFQIASENMTPAHWLTLSRKVNACLQDPEVVGLVITHGTDTTEETAWFLELTVGSDKPVVLTAAMRPSTALSADGPLNLYNAVAVAASPEARGKGVLVAMNDRIHAARDVAKAHTTAVDAFQSSGAGPLGYLVSGQPVFDRLPGRPVKQRPAFDVSGAESLPLVEIVYACGGSGRRLLDAAVATGARGIVNAGVGNGSLSQEALAGCQEAVKKGVAVVRASRTGAGPVVRNGEVRDDDYGFVAAGTLSPQKARILLMLALTRTSDAGALQKLFDTY